MPSPTPGFIILNRDESFAPDPQSILMEQDFATIVSGIYNTGVRSGCAVTAQAVPNMTVAVDGGNIVSQSVVHAVAAGNVTIDAADAMPRIDCIVADGSGDKQVRKGTADPHPKAPEVSAADVLLAMVLVPAGALAIVGSYITDKRVFLPDHNALTNLATGDPHTQYALLAGRAGGQTLNLGAVIPPTNVTAGDLTATRALIGTDAAIPTHTTAYVNAVLSASAASAGYGLWIDAAVSPNGGGPGALRAALHALLTLTPAGNESTAGYYGLQFLISQPSGDFNTGRWYGVIGNLNKGALGTATTMTGCQMYITASAGNVTTVYGYESSFTLTGAGTITTATHFQVSAGGFPTALTTLRGLNIPNLGDASVTNAIGIDIAAQSGAATLNIGIRLVTAAQGALWFNSDTASQTAGLVFGTTRDVNLYRSAADVLKTDDSLLVLGHLGVGSGAAINTLYTVNLKHTYTDPAGTVYGVFSQDTINFTADSAADVYGMSLFPTPHLASGKNLTGTVYGLVSGFYLTSLGGGATYSLAVAWQPYAAVGAATTVTEVDTIHIATPFFTGTCITHYGIKIDDLSNAGTNYAIYLSGTSGLARQGIWWNGDTNLYRTAANVLATDDALRVAVYGRVGSVVAPTNVTAGDFNAVRLFVGADAAFTAGVTAAEFLGRCRIGGADTWLDWLTVTTPGNVANPAANDVRLWAYRHATGVLGGAMRFLDESGHDSGVTVRGKNVFPVPMTPYTATKVAITPTTIQGRCGLVTVDAPIMLHTIAFNASTASNGTTGVVRLAVYSETGVLIASVSCAAGTAITLGVNVFTLAADVYLPAGTYYAAILKGAQYTVIQPVFSAFTQDNTFQAVAGQEVVCGTFVAVGGALPDPIGVITSADNSTPMFKFYGTAL